ncbi:MAG: DNA (cytosine-5-)-methyltransferase [Isosphaeraceae bacterium]
MSKLAPVLTLEGSSSRPKTFCEFFAGIGLVREALNASGWRCVYANDIEPKKRELYLGRFHDGEHFHLGDVHATRDVVARIPETPFLATASFPCIDLSLAGHWRGFEGKHSSTFFGFIEALRALDAGRPPLVLLENVVGFLTSHDGRDFVEAAEALAGLGYWIDAFVLDAAYFVPQSRPRVFVVGVQESVDAPQAVRRRLPDWLADEWGDLIDARPRSLLPPKLAALMRSTPLATGWCAFKLRAPVVKRKHLAELIDLDEGQAWWDEAAVQKHRDMMSDRHQAQVEGLLAEKALSVGTIYRRKRYGKTMAEVRFDGVAGCLRTPRGGSGRQIVIVLDEGRVRMRWMNAREYARLQGADDFPLVENNIQNLFGFGDAVCVPAVRWVDQEILTPVYEAVSRRGEVRGRQPHPRTAP